MTRAAWKVLYRLLRICRRESAKAAKDFVIFGIGAVMFDPTLPDCIRHVPIEELQTKYKEYLYGWPSDRIDGNAQGTALMNQSPDLQDLYLALATAQGAIENAAKESQNPAFAKGAGKGKYADLASVRDAYRIPFSANGLALIQLPSTEGKKVTVVTRLAHKSGQFVEESMSMNAATETPHAIGSTLTYIRRYAAMCFTGVAPEDDDGNAASASDASHDEHPPRQSGDDIDQREAAEAAEAARAFVDNAKRQFAKMTTTSEMATWWKDHKDGFPNYFKGNADPRWIELRTAFTLRSTEVAPADNGEPKQQPRPTYKELTNSFYKALQDVKSLEEAQAAYTELIGPHESTFTPNQLGALKLMIDDRMSVL